MGAEKLSTNILAIDCSYGMNISIFANGKDYVYSCLESKKQSDSLLLQIDELLSQAKLNLKDIDTIAVCVGPGSFTGIRVAISTAKGLAIGTKANIVTFTSFETLVPEEKNYGVLVEGFGDNTYYYLNKFGRMFMGCDSKEKILKLFSDVNVYTLSQKNLQMFEELEPKLSKYDAKNAVIEKIQQNKFILSNQIAPLYLRASQAEIERNKHGN